MALLSGGDDYELVFTVPSKHVSKIRELSKIHSVQIKNIGKITSQDLHQDVITLKDINQKIMKIYSEGYQHFHNWITIIIL